MSLTTFRHDGRGVATPVWFALDGEQILVYTDAASGKVKRLRGDPKVTVAPCTNKGVVTGPARAGTAEVLPAGEGDRVMALIDRKCGLTKKLLGVWNKVSRLVSQRQPTETAYLAITLAQA